MFLSAGNCLAVLPASGQVPSKPAVGSLSKASHATVNGKPVAQGATLFSDSRLTTGKAGEVVALLGRIGTVRLDGESELGLRFAGGNIGGELFAGRLLISAGTGTSLAVLAAGVKVTSDGGAPNTLAVEVVGGEVRFVSLLRDVRLSVGGDEVTVTKGQMVKVEAEDPRRRRRVLPVGFVATGVGVGAAASLATIFNRASGSPSAVLSFPGVVDPSPVRP
jgi:hypothetical protein